MKKITLIFALLISVSAFAGNWRPAHDHSISYVKRGLCESVHAVRCFNFGDCQETTCRPKDVQVNDLDKPLYGPEIKASSPYASLSECQAAIAPYLQDMSVGCTQDIIDTGNHHGSTVCEQQVLPFCYDQEPAAGYALRALCGEDFHAYCIARDPQSYLPKWEKRLLEDPALKAAFEAAEQAKADAKAQLASQVAACKTAMDALNWDSATQAQTRAAVRCMRRMFKRMGR